MLTHDLDAINLAMARFQRQRDSKVRRLRKAGKGASEIARTLGVSRQRAQQLIKRVARNANRKRGNGGKQT